MRYYYDYSHLIIVSLKIWVVGFLQKEEESACCHRGHWAKVGRMIFALPDERLQTILDQLIPGTVTAADLCLYVTCASQPATDHRIGYVSIARLRLLAFLRPAFTLLNNDNHGLAAILFHRPRTGYGGSSCLTHHNSLYWQFLCSSVVATD